MCLAFTAQDFRFLLRLGDDLDDLAVGPGPDALRRLVAACPQPLGFRQTFGLHAVVGLLRDFRGQIRPADAHVLDVEAERCRIRAQLVTHLAHHDGALL